MLKPLSQKTLETKYASLGLSEKKLDALHAHFRAVANLYGMMSVQEAWDLFRQYEGTVFVHKKEFVAFAGVAQRQEDLPYYVIDINEVFSEEKPLDEMRLIVNKRLVLRGMHRFYPMYALYDKCQKYSIYVPEKDVFRSFVEDRFYQTKAGKEMVAFISALKTTGCGFDISKEKLKLKDVNGQSVKGKRLDSFSFITPDEQFDIDYTKNETTKKALTQEYTELASTKALNLIKRRILEGEFFDDVSAVSTRIETLRRDFGVEMTMATVQKFIALYTELHNTSHMWCMFGWSPNELSAKYGSGRPKSISIGPNMKEMIANGELDPDDLRKKLDELGIEMIL